MQQSSSSSAATTSWHWHGALPNTVSILTLPPAATTAEVREEIPDWAIPSRAPPGLSLDEDPTYSVKVDVSPSLRTDISFLTISVRTSLTVQAFKQRLAAILQVVPERLRICSSGEQVRDHLAIHTEVSVHDQWERELAAYDVLDVIMDGDPQPRLPIRGDQLWTHEQLITYIARVMGKSVLQIRVTDQQGNLWRYPDDKARTSTVLVNVASKLSEELQSYFSRTCPSDPDPLRTPSPRPDLDPFLT